MSETIDVSRYGDLAPALRLIQGELLIGEPLQRVINAADTNLRVFGVSIFPGKDQEIVGVVDRDHSLAANLGEVCTAFVQAVSPETDSHVIPDALHAAAESGNRFALFRLPQTVPSNKTLASQAGDALTELFIHIRANYQGTDLQSVRDTLPRHQD
ncbi:MAG: hypothetical protein ACE5DX_00565 [Candidatus Dojkabacteria bacterium]